MNTNTAASWANEMVSRNQIFRAKLQSIDDVEGLDRWDDNPNSVVTDEYISAGDYTLKTLSDYHQDSTTESMDIEFYTEQNGWSEHSSRAKSGTIIIKEMGSDQNGNETEREVGYRIGRRVHYLSNRVGHFPNWRL